MRINPSGNIGIGTGSPATKLHLNSGILTIDGSGSGIVNTYGIQTSTIQITNGAAAGYVLTSDAGGNASWQADAAASLLNSTNTWTAPQTFTTTEVINSTFTQSASPSLAMFTPDGNIMGFFPSMGPGYYNPLAQAADSGMVFAGPTLALSIVPWATNISGIRITTATVTIADDVNNSGYKIQTSSLAFTGVTQNADAGFVGEIVEGKTSTPINAAASGSFAAIASCTLTPGEWDISGVGELYGNSATFSTGDVVLCMSAASASSSGCTDGYDIIYWYTSGSLGAGHRSMVIPRKRVLITGNTTYYLNGQALYSAGTPQWTGSISARRIR
jgi:hypothetical protein